jgi:hypothetical protein
VAARAAALGEWEANRHVQKWQAAHPAAPLGNIIALGQALEERIGMRPVWTHRGDVESWLSGLEAVLRVTEGDGALVLDAALEMRDRGLPIPEPYSLVKMARDTAARARAHWTGGAPVNWLN